MPEEQFPELSSRLIRQQVVYQGSRQALATAQAIVATKITQTSLFLTNYIRSRRRSGHDSVQLLQQIQNRLQSLVSAADKASNRPVLFRLEARAAVLHWRMFALLCRTPVGWRRVYPYAADTINVLLNTGYTMLSRQCDRALQKAGLLTQLGVYHGDTSRHPLVYDFMECFRLPLVDAVLVGILARRSNYDGIEKESYIFRRMLAKLTGRYQSRFKYNKRCEKLLNIIELEAFALKRAILLGKVWQPRIHSWAHHKKC